MHGISNKSAYEQWTSLFNPTSTYEGSLDKTQLMTSAFANGIYFVTVEIGRERITKKLVIEK